MKRRRVTSVDFSMDFYVKDFIASTIEMTGAERAAYMLSLGVAWTQGASLPADPERIRGALNYSPEEWKKLWPTLESKWPIDQRTGRRRNRRQVAEWEIASARFNGFRVRAAAGVDARRQLGLLPELAPDVAPRVQHDVAPDVHQASNQRGTLSPSPSPSYPSPTGKAEVTTEDTADAARPIRFVPPTKKEISEYAVSKGWTKADWNTVAFFEFYGGKGWTIGKSPMKDWRLTACRAHREGWTVREGNGSGPRVVVHKNQRDLDAEQEAERIRRGREAEARKRRTQADEERILGEVLEEKRKRQGMEAKP